MTNAGNNAAPPHRLDPDSIRTKYLPVALVGLIGFIITLIAFDTTSEMAERWAEDEFTQVAAALTMAIERKKNDYWEFIYAANDPELLADRSAFSRYANFTMLQCPSICAMVWSPGYAVARNPASTGADHGEHADHSDRSSLSSMAPTTERAHRVRFTQPSNLAALPPGTDLSAVPGVAPLIPATRGRRQIVAGNSMPWQKSNGECLAVPVALSSMSTAMQPRPREDPRMESGVILVIIDIEMFLRSVTRTADQRQLTECIVIDRSLIGEPKLLFSSHNTASPDADTLAAAYESGIHWSRSVNVGSRHWEILVRPSQSFTNNRSRTVTYAVLMSGLILTAVLILYLGSLTRHIIQIEHLASALTRTNHELELAHRELEANHKKILETEKFKTAQEMARVVVGESRQPLTTLLLGIHIIQENTDPGLAVEKSRELLGDAFERLSGLLQRLMQLTSMEDEKTIDAKIVKTLSPYRQADDVRQRHIRRILIIEDEESLAEALAIILRNMNMDVETAATSDDGLERLKQETFDLVFSDITLPGSMNGVEIARAAGRCGRNVPFIFMSAFPIRDEWRDVVNKSGGFLLKPFNMADVRQALENSTHVKTGHRNGDEGDH